LTGKTERVRRNEARNSFGMRAKEVMSVLAGLSAGILDFKEIKNLAATLRAEIREMDYERYCLLSDINKIANDLKAAASRIDLNAEEHIATLFRIEEKQREQNEILKSIEKWVGVASESLFRVADTQALLREENKEEFDTLELQIAKVGENTSQQYELLSRQIYEYEQDNNWFHIELQKQVTNVNYKVFTWKQKSEKLSYMSKQLKQLLKVEPLASKQIQDSLRIYHGRVSQIIAELGKQIVWKDVKTGKRGRPKRIFKLKKEGDEIE